MNKILFLILLTVTIISCRSVITRNLAGRIVLDEVKASNDTVDFYIKEIKLINVESLKACDVWGEGSPSFNLYITITNKLNESVYLIPVKCYEDFFIGIYPPELKLKLDTLGFGNACDGYPSLLEPKSSVDVVVGSLVINSDRFFDSTRLDNTEPMLNLIREMKFYYAPLPKEVNIGQDTVVIDRSHRLRTDENTKITSWSRIR